MEDKIHRMNYACVLLKGATKNRIRNAMPKAIQELYLLHFVLILFTQELPLVKKANDLSSYMLPPGFLVVHDSGRCSENDVAKLTGRKKFSDPFFKVGEANIIARTDYATFVEAAIKLYNNFARAMIIDFFKLANVTYRKIFC